MESLLQFIENIRKCSKATLSGTDEDEISGKMCAGNREEPEDTNLEILTDIIDKMTGESIEPGIELSADDKEGAKIAK